MGMFMSPPLYCRIDVLIMQRIVSHNFPTEPILNKWLTPC
jgi:hypothetical protein